MASRRPNVATIVSRLVLYLLAAWGTIGVLSAGLFPGALAVVVLVALYTTLPLVAFARWRGWPFYPGAAFRLFVVRPFWYSQLMLPLVSAGGLLGVLGGAPFGHAIDAGRVLALGVFVFVAIALLAGYLGTMRLVVRRVDTEIPGLAPEFEGLRIVQLSDLHVGPHTSRRFLRRVVETARRLEPDIIAVTGDLIDDRAEDVASYAAALGTLAAPLGVYMIPGNHDVYAGWEEVEHALRAANIGTVLVNEMRVVTRGSASIALVGTGDPAGGTRGSSRAAPDVDRALSQVPDGATVIAFAHNPALWPALAKRGVALTLSGHTHWGQFAVPKLGWSLASPFLEHAMGAHLESDTLLYISPGTGYWGIPFRLGASPEVTLVTLRRADTASARVHPARSTRSRAMRRATTALMMIAAASCASMPASSARTPRQVADELLGADRSFAASGLTGLSAMMTSDVVMPAPQGRFVRGAEVASTVIGTGGAAITELSWTPIRAGISADAQQGFTFGFMNATRADGTQVPLRYLSYWTKVGGEWRVAAFKRARRGSDQVSMATLAPSLPDMLVAPTIDVATIGQHRESLAAAERAFSAEAHIIGLGPAFAKFGSVDAMNLGGSNTSGFVMGADSIAKLVGAGAGVPGGIFWGPEEVIVASSGDLGVSIGYIRPNLQIRGASGAAFFTVWRRATPSAPWRYIAE